MLCKVWSGQALKHPATLMKPCPSTETVLTDSKPPEEVEACARELQCCGHALKQLDFVGRDDLMDEPVAGCCKPVSRGNMACRVKCWGTQGAFWGGTWGWLFGSTFFKDEGGCLLMEAGPLGCWIVGAMEGSILLGGLSVLGACLFSLGISNEPNVLREPPLKQEMQ